MLEAEIRELEAERDKSSPSDKGDKKPNLRLVS